MPGTRSSARQAAKGNSKPPPAEDRSSSGGAGTKRKADATPSSQSKKGKKEISKNQTTIEETLNPEGVSGNQNGSNDVEMKDQDDVGQSDPIAAPKDEAKGGEQIDKDWVVVEEGDAKTDTKVENGQTEGVAVSNTETNDVEMKGPEEAEKGEETAASGVGDDHHGEQAKVDQNAAQGKSEAEESKPNGFDKLMDQESKEKEEENKKVTAEGTGSKVSAAESAVETSSKRENATPSSILEKGIIYFFFRGRVGVEEPTDVADIARSYIVLRPLPHGAKLGEGPIGDEKKNRMLALPKKVLPKSPKDRFMVFVEKANVSLDEIKETLSSSDYTTKTVGARHTPAATPIGEGVYAITQTGRDTHLAYILTIPAKLEAVQEDIGLRQQGSYHTSAKNPESKAPANTSLPQGAKYPQEIIDEFHGRGWMPLAPKLLDYENTQFLIIGHGQNALENAAQPQGGEENKMETVTPLEEIEKLEHEDKLRVEHLDGENSIFTDLGLTSKEYPQVQTTW